ncbi:hypothetical protein CFC21_022819, partial [Triticum aestivum]
IFRKVVLFTQSVFLVNVIGDFPDISGAQFAKHLKQ